MEQNAKFSPKNYQEAVKNAFWQGVFAGEPVSSKEEIYERISKEVNKSYDTVRKWGNSKATDRATQKTSINWKNYLEYHCERKPVKLLNCYALIALKIVSEMPIP